MRETLRSLAKMEEAQVVPLLSIHLHNVYPKGRRAYSLLQTTMEPLPHGLWSCSSKSLTGRTGHRLRDASVYWNYWRYNLNRTLPLPDKDSLYYNDMPCWLHSIEATTDPAGHHLANRHLAGDRLRIASLRIVPGHPGGLHRSSRLPTTFLMTNHPH